MKNMLLQLKVWKDRRGQDLIEYALMAGFVAVAAGAVMPGIADSISTIFSKVSSALNVAVGTTCLIPSRIVVPVVVAPEPPCQVMLQPPIWLPRSLALLPAT